MHCPTWIDLTTFSSASEEQICACGCGARRRRDRSASGVPWQAETGVHWYLNPDGDGQVAEESDVTRSYVTYHTRKLEDGGSEVAILSWFYRRPSLVALFRNGELVEGELWEAVKPIDREAAVRDSSRRLLR